MSLVNARRPAARRRARRRGGWPLAQLSQLCLVAAVGLAAAACGKKGPPLAPIAHVPAAVDKVAGRRVGNDVFVSLTVPAQNIDATKPGDVGRIDVYAVTATAPPPLPRFLEIATLVATIPVAAPPDPAAAATGAAAPLSTTEPPQGAAITIRDTLTPDQLIPRTLPVIASRSRPLAAPGQPVSRPASALDATAPGRLATPPPLPVTPTPRRYYMAIAFSERGRPGPPSAIVELPLTAIPDAPLALDAVVAATQVMLSWPPSGGLLGFLLDRGPAPESAPVDEPVAAAVTAAPAVVDMPPGPTHYNVYREVAPDPLVLASRPNVQPWNTTPPAPAPLSPGTALMTSDVVDNDRERCYTVRAVRGAAAQAIESDASPRVCVTPVDVVPPAPPAGLSAVGAEGLISLIWEPNAEEDLGGYMVLRGAPGDATLQPLTDTPIVDARFSDRTAVPGVRYEYAVQALDTRLPLPNVSAPSARVDEIAR